MKLRGHGNGLAIAIATLALAVAGTGTAVAVSSTTTISDPDVPARIAHVDSSGRLTTVGVNSTLALATNVSTPSGGYLTTIVTSTTASIAITKLAIADPRVNSAASNANYTVYLEKDSVDANGVCSRNGSKILAQYLLAPGDYINDVFATPLVVKATGSAKYCLGLFGTTSNGAADTGPYFAYAQFNGFVANGTYSGIGTLSQPATIDPRQVKTQR